MFKNKKIFSRLDKMLDDGINGTFEETDYDESKLSSIESKWYRYLASSKLSENKINIEREKIKELVSDISHQTKTPLTNINLYSQILLEQNLDESSKYLANEIQKQTQKLNFLIQSLVKTSRLETGTFQLNPKKNNLHDLIVRSIEALKIKANNKKITINYVKTDEEAIFDIKWTTEALCNILDNAIKYSDEKGTIDIFVKPYEMFANICIKDNGIGILEDEIEKIFGRFYRGTNVVEDEGTGIGLYLAREILEKQGGYIYAESVVGNGSVFKICIPKWNLSILLDFRKLLERIICYIKCSKKIYCT